MFIPLADGADLRSRGRVSQWVNWWWGDWCDAPLVRIDENKWFELPNITGPGLWMPPAAAMKTVIMSRGRVSQWVNRWWGNWYNAHQWRIDENKWFELP